MKKTIARVLLLLLLIALLIGGAIFLYRYTNGFNEDFKTFYIERDGERILSENSTSSFRPGETVTYQVGYLFSGSKSESRDYNVTIVPNPQADFSFWVGNYSFSWGGTRPELLEKIFALEKGETSFTFHAPEFSGMKSFLSALYPELGGSEAVTIEGQVADTNFLLLIVSSYNGRVNYAVEYGFDKTNTYAITHKVSPESYANYVDIRCKKEAYGGEEIQFAFFYGIQAESPKMILHGVYLIDPGTNESQEIFCNLQFTYSFSMPFHDVIIEIKFDPI